MQTTFDSVASNIVNNLTTNDSTKALSAAQGYTLNSRIASAFTFHQATLGSYKQTTANAWENTGFSIVVPTNHVYIGTLYGGYNSGRPIGIGVDNATSLSGDTPSQSAESSNGQFSVAVILYPGTWKVYTKRASAGTANNNYYFRYIDIG